MAIWKEPTTTKKEAPIMTPEPALQKDADLPVDIVPSTTRRTAPREAKESIIAADITITGKIDGTGHVRIAGRFEGDVHIQGDLTIDSGAKLTGAVRANCVTIGGEVEGNIESAASVEMLNTGVLNGDLKAGTLTVASGSRMRGRVEFGWGDERDQLPVTTSSSSKSSLSLGARHAS
ncbi:MAG: polymer-forming cytoskeletal protein [Gemmatimonadaceae bacterium]|jgi:cytoskeletal protein CcmA (bactofilin family)